MSDRERIFESDKGESISSPGSLKCHKLTTDLSGATVVSIVMGLSRLHIGRERRGRTHTVQKLTVTRLVQLTGDTIFSVWNCLHRRLRTDQL